METTRDSGVFLFIYIYIYTVKCQYSSTKQSIQKSCVYAMIILLSIQSSCSIAFHPFVSIIKCSIRVSNYICPQWSYSSSSPNLIFFFFLIVISFLSTTILPGWKFWHYQSVLKSSCSQFYLEPGLLFLLFHFSDPISSMKQ